MVYLHFTIQHFRFESDTAQSGKTISIHKRRKLVNIKQCCKFYELLNQHWLLLFWLDYIYAVGAINDAVIQIWGCLKIAALLLYHLYFEFWQHWGHVWWHLTFTLENFIFLIVTLFRTCIDLHIVTFGEKPYPLPMWWVDIMNLIGSPFAHKNRECRPESVVQKLIMWDWGNLSR